MCMSFTDLDLTRQELLYTELLHYAQDYAQGDSYFGRYYATVAEHQAAYLAEERYGKMTDVELTSALTDAKTGPGRAGAVPLIQAELDKLDAAKELLAFADEVAQVIEESGIKTAPDFKVAVAA